MQRRDYNMKTKTRTIVTSPITEKQLLGPDRPVSLVFTPSCCLVTLPSHLQRGTWEELLCSWVPLPLSSKSLETWSSLNTLRGRTERARELDMFGTRVLKLQRMEWILYTSFFIQLIALYLNPLLAPFSARCEPGVSAKSSGPTSVCCRDHSSECGAGQTGAHNKHLWTGSHGERAGACVVEDVLS